MHTKLTLRLDENLIAQAKEYAAREGRSLSDLVAAYFARLAEPASATAKPASAYPKTSSLMGAMAGSTLDESDYKKHLENKYL